MKARNKKTGEIVNVCLEYDGSWHESSDERLRRWQTDELDFDYAEWDIFRREAAKDILCSLIHDGRMRADASTVKSSIWLAEELISQLKEEEKK